MRSRTSFFEKLGDSLRDAAPLWVLYSLATSVSLTCTDIQNMRIPGDLGGKYDAKIPVIQ